MLNSQQDIAMYERQIDFEYAAEKLDEMRKKSVAFLEEAL